MQVSQKTKKVSFSRMNRDFLFLCLEKSKLTTTFADIYHQ